jgi:poly(3-hydroxyalkanoate) synthetase
MAGQSPFPPAPFLWPALAAASTTGFLSVWAEQVAQLTKATPPPAAATPKWATPHTIALDLLSMCLRDFSIGTHTEIPTLICAPFALHRATIADFARGHSLVATLRRAGLSSLYVTDWRSATPQMRYLCIDNYLADLCVAVDELGGKVDLIGLCQGGWMALLFAARFPRKVRKLVLAGAPVDIRAEESALSQMVDRTPLAAFEQVVELGGGRVLGERMLGFWGHQAVDEESVCRVLQISNGRNSNRLMELQAEFKEWHFTTVDLPGTYYLEVVDWVFKQNRIAEANFVALGRRIDLGQMRAPLFLLAARDDEIVAPQQQLAVDRHVGTPAGEIEAAIAPCNHLGLFMGARSLRTVWPRIARWLTKERAAPSDLGGTEEQAKSA